MLIALNNEDAARKAVFTADRGRLFGGQHLTDGAGGTMWANMCPISSTYSSLRVQPSDWRGS